VFCQFYFLQSHPYITIFFHLFDLLRTQVDFRFYLSNSYVCFPFFIRFFFLTFGGRKSSKTQLGTVPRFRRKSRFALLAPAASRENEKNNKNCPGLVENLWRAAAEAPSPRRAQCPVMSSFCAATCYRHWFRRDCTGPGEAEGWCLEK